MKKILLLTIIISVLYVQNINVTSSSVSLITSPLSGIIAYNYTVYEVYDWGSVFNGFYDWDNYGDMIIALVSDQYGYALYYSYDAINWSILARIPTGDLSISLYADIGKAVSVVDHYVFVSMTNYNYDIMRIYRYDLDTGLWSNYTFNHAGSFWHGVVKLGNGSYVFGVYPTYPFVYRSDDQGKTWKLWININSLLNITTDHIHDLAWDPYNDRLIIAYGDHPHGILLYYMNGSYVNIPVLYAYDSVFSSITRIFVEKDGLVMGTDSFGAPPLLITDHSFNVINQMFDRRYFLWDGIKTGDVYYLAGYKYSDTEGDDEIPIVVSDGVVYAEIIALKKPYSWRSLVYTNDDYIAGIVDGGKYIVKFKAVDTEWIHYKYLENSIHMGYPVVLERGVYNVSYYPLVHDNSIAEIDNWSSMGLPESSFSLLDNSSLELSAPNTGESHIGFNQYVSVTNGSNISLSFLVYVNNSIGQIHFILGYYIYYTDGSYSSFIHYDYNVPSNRWILITLPNYTVSSNVDHLRIYVYVYDGTRIFVDRVWIHVNLASATLSLGSKPFNFTESTSFTIEQTIYGYTTDNIRVEYTPIITSNTTQDTGSTPSTSGGSSNITAMILVSAPDIQSSAIFDGVVSFILVAVALYIIMFRPRDIRYVLYVSVIVLSFSLLMMGVRSIVVKGYSVVNGTVRYTYAQNPFALLYLAPMMMGVIGIIYYVFQYFRKLKKYIGRYGVKTRWGR